MPAAHKGAISFGLVHIPVALHTATQDNDIHFNQLCKEDGSRVKYKKVCANCGKEVGTQDIVKGFEFAPGQYVTMTDTDFEKAKTEKDKTIQILHFTDIKIYVLFILTKLIMQLWRLAETKPMNYSVRPCLMRVRWQ